MLNHKKIATENSIRLEDENFLNHSHQEGIAICRKDTEREKMRNKTFFRKLNTKQKNKQNYFNISSVRFSQSTSQHFLPEGH